MKVRQQAFTLIEIIVASALGLVILTLLLQLFIPALRAWNDGQRRSEVGQSLLLSSKWLEDDILRCSPGSLELTEEEALVMKCALGQIEDYNNNFTEFVAYWCEDGDLYRATLQLDSPDAEPSLLLADLKALKNLRKVASGVEQFEVQVLNGWSAIVHLAVDKMGRRSEIRTAYSSIYAPFDLKIAEANETREPPPLPRLP